VGVPCPVCSLLDWIRANRTNVARVLVGATCQNTEQTIRRA